MTGPATLHATSGDAGDDAAREQQHRNEERDSHDHTGVQGLDVLARARVTLVPDTDTRAEEVTTTNTIPALSLTKQKITHQPPNTTPAD